ncbi:MAG: DUF2520 domain-containing protein [Chitinophagaceae bacterium]|nr:MAG: DUF2520 domain-containing protein [Chitinophagaceae bacterium]
MNIVIIGSGNVAAVFGRRLVKAGHTIQQIVSRNAATATELAYEWNTESANYFSVIHKDADVYIIAVPDKAIAEVAKDIQLPNDKIIVHTAASVEMNTIAGITQNYGVFYPLQSITSNISEEVQIPIFIEASNDKTKTILESLAISMGALTPQYAGFDKRIKLHLSAVLVNNFTNYLYTLAQDFMEKEGLDFKEMLPIIKNTTDRLSFDSPKNMQTGPAKRQDLETIARHRDILKTHPQLLQVYNFMTDNIMMK